MGFLIWAFLIVAVVLLAIGKENRAALWTWAKDTGKRLIDRGGKTLPAIALACALIGGGSANALACVTVDMAKARGAEVGHQFVVLTPVQRAVAAAKFNAEEPKTDTVFSDIAIASTQGKYLFLGFVNGCLEAVNPLPEGWTEDVIGRAADGKGLLDGGSAIITAAHAADLGPPAPAAIWGKGDYVALMFAWTFVGPLLMWLGLRILDKLADVQFAERLDSFDQASQSFYFAARWLGAAMILASSMIGIGLAVAS